MGAKGNLLVGQSGGPTAVINNSLVGVIHEALQQQSIGEIYGMVHGIKGTLHKQFVDLRRETPEILELLRQTPASALGTVRYKVKPEDYEPLLQVFMDYDIRYFFYIGGNDSADTTHQIAQLAARRGYEMYAIGVPKTVDNDLAKTDHCPGYGSAARFVAAAVRDTGYDTEAMGDSGPLKAIEIMGRNAGWLAAAAALGKTRPEDPPQLVYVPEHGISQQQLVDDVKFWYKELGYCVLAVSEGIKDDNNVEFAKSAKDEVDAFGHKRKAGVVEYVAGLIKEATGETVRWDKPQYLQRSCAELASTVDREEAYQVGRAAVRAAVAGTSDHLVTINRLPGPKYAMELGLAPLSEIANVEHKLPLDYMNAQGNGVTQRFIEYALPLIGEPLLPFARLAKHIVKKH